VALSCAGAGLAILGVLLVITVLQFPAAVWDVPTDPSHGLVDVVGNVAAGLSIVGLVAAVGAAIRRERLEVALVAGVMSLCVVLPALVVWANAIAR
jgi:hypothetical protein